MPNATPRQVLTWSLRTLYVAGPLAVATLAAWGFRLVPGMYLRPQLVLMAYLMLLGVCTVAGVSACLAMCHLTIGRAFGAGVRVGQQLEPGAPKPPELRLVE